MKINIKKSFRKTMSLQIKNGEVLVKAPFFTSEKTINNFLEKHKNWIERNLERQEKNKIDVSKISEYKIEAQKYIVPRVKDLANKFGFTYNIIKITSAKIRWGSCTSKKNLNFSFRLILCPREVIDYVIIHELAHLRHMNHSKRFWQEVEKMMPEYKEKRKWLREKGAIY